MLEPRRSSSVATVVLGIICIALSATPAFAWGDEGHALINRTAAQNVPATMPEFFRSAADRIAYLGPEPDRWRDKAEPSLKNAQEPDHFIDLERVEGMQLPVGRYDYYRLLYAKRTATNEHSDDYLPEKVGLQPYIAMEIYERLKVAFRNYRALQQQHQPTAAVEQDAIFYAGWLGHYVGDAAQPLHTTVNYNGWVGPNPNGYTTAHDIHWKFEGPFVAQHVNQLALTGLVKPPSEVQNPFQDYLSYLRDSHTLVERVYQIEKSHGLEGDGTPEAIEFVRSRLAVGTQMLLNLWYTAWMESAKPLPPKSY